MTDFYHITADFKTIIDFLRFGVSEANRHALHFGHGTDNAWDDISALILGFLGLPFDIHPLHLQSRLTAEEKEKLTHLLQQRIQERIPVPYLLHQAYFCGLSFYVDERVLIPRSPIAEWIEKHFFPWINAPVARILDLCTGSGAIAIACAYAFPEAKIDAVDISKDALAVAMRNGEDHGLKETITWIESDCWSNVPAQRYDIIVSNPPYVGSKDMQSLPKEYTYEPVLALKAAHNGLAIIAEILAKAHHFLSEEGILVVEVGLSEGAVEEAFPDLAFTWLDFERGGEGVFLLTAAQLSEYSSTKKLSHNTIYVKEH